jgi:hypothetical protein
MGVIRFIAGLYREWRELGPLLQQHDDARQEAESDTGYSPEPAPTELGDLRNLFTAPVGASTHRRAAR